MPTLQEVYATVSQLTPTEKLRLAARLLDDVVRKEQLLADRSSLEGYSEEWSDEDIREFAAASARYMDSQYPEEADYPLPKETKNVQSR